MLKNTTRQTTNRVLIGLAGLALMMSSDLAQAGAVVMDLQSQTIFGYTTSGQNRQVAAREKEDRRYTTKLKPPTPGAIDNTGGDFFFDTLSSWANGTGWTFASAIHTLSDNSMKIRTYDAVHNATKQGVEFHVQYVPGEGDPVDNIHWIQVVRNNWNITAADPADRGPGNAELVVDNPFSTGNRSPYYDDGGAANSRHFYDFPGRGPEETMFWEAELFLAVGPAADSPGLITLYRPGISWGWETTVEVIPTPGVMTLMALGGLTAARRRRC